MKEDKLEPGDAKFSALLRSGRPRSELPPGFRDAVWRRIEKGHFPSVNIVERLALWFLRPRFVTVTISVVIVLAAGVGAIRGVQKGERQARDHYIASVDPSYLQR